MLSFKLHLSKSGQEKLLNKLSQSRNNGNLQEYSRISAILLFSDGYDAQQIANIFKISLGCVYKWLKN